MNKGRIAFAFAAILVLAGCNNGNKPHCKGWVEAESDLRRS